MAKRQSHGTPTDQSNSQALRRKAHGATSTQTKSSTQKTTTRRQTKEETTFHPATNIRLKYEDIGRPPTTTGRVAEHWSGEKLLPIYAKMRSGPVKMPATYRYWDHAFLMEHYGLKGWEFGNWTSQEDRFNYVCAVGISLFDMCKVLGFRPKDIGLIQHISMAIGARGKSRAKAHFEPRTWAINLTRFYDDSINPFTGQMQRIPKEIKFQIQGGAGSLAHEYGHALDYFFGTYMDHHSESVALSGGNIVRKDLAEDIIKGSGPRADMEELMNVLIWENYEKKQLTTYYQNILDYMEALEITSTYYLRRNEIFARIFEQYIGEKLKQKGMVNAFLHKQKYERAYYAPPKEFNRARPIIERMVRKMKAWIKTKH